MQHLGLICKILLIVGGLNWLLVGTMGMDLVATLFGDMTMLARLVYILVGAAAIYEIIMMVKARA